jgi:hypothetical protein
MRGRAAWKAQARSGEPVTIKNIESLAVSSLPKWAQGWSTVEIKMYGGFWRALRGVPVAMSERFTVSKGARSVSYFAISMLAVLALAAAGLLLLAGWSTTLKSLLIGGACIAGPALYLLVMLMGERRVLKETGHSVGDATLGLALGVRLGAEIPMADVLSCARLSASAPAGMDTLVVAPFDVPNVLVGLREGAVLDAVRFGYPFTSGKQMLALYVDEPEYFVDAVNAVISRQLPKCA